MASRTRWTCVWVNSRSWRWTRRPGLLWFMGSQKVGHDWATELNWNAKWPICISITEITLKVICFNNYSIELLLLIFPLPIFQKLQKFLGITTSNINYQVCCRMPLKYFLFKKNNNSNRNSIFIHKFWELWYHLA